MDRNNARKYFFTSLLSFVFALCLMVSAGVAQGTSDDDFLEAAPARDIYGLSTKKVALTILYNAASNGEFRPCPT